MIPHKPILFSTAMVQAILNGNKSMTRRTKGLENVAKVVTEIAMVDAPYFWDNNAISYKCPYGNVGDLLWVREKFFKSILGVLYAASYEKKENTMWSWKPSIHMPKIDARIWLKIEDIRVERLQDIEHTDAISEGIEPLLMSGTQLAQQGQLYRNYLAKPELLNEGVSALYSFKSLWKSINGDENWKSNPWVWVIKFSRVEKPNL